MNKRIAKYIPNQETIRANKHLQFLDRHLQVANLWHFNRRSVAGGVAIGLFCAWVPIPFQMVLATIFAIIFSVNLPIPVALVWITNPVTMPVLYYFSYWLGAKILNTPVLTIQFEPNISWLMQILGEIWQPFLLGSFVIGAGSALLGYMIVKIAWRYHVIRRWRTKHPKQKRPL